MLEWLQNIASYITAFTVIGSALIWVYKKTVAGPIEARRLEQQEREANALQDAVRDLTKPLVDSITSIEKTRVFHDESINKLSEIADSNSKLIEQHDDMLKAHEILIGEHGKELDFLKGHIGRGR